MQLSKVPAFIIDGGLLLVVTGMKWISSETMNEYMALMSAAGVTLYAVHMFVRIVIDIIKSFKKKKNDTTTKEEGSV